MKNNKMLKRTTALVLCSSLICNMSVFAVQKDETVYTKLRTNGEEYNKVVSVHLKNIMKDKEIKDMSDLLNIKNVSSDNTFTQNGNTLVWNAQGEDIYYNGESKKELPIKCTVKYELNGNEIEPNDLVGKTGKLKITISYENKDEHIVNINGADVKLYTPFVVFGGTVFSNNKVSNVTVSTGKVVDDGSKTIVVGLALPGMQESLGISKDTLKVPENIEINMEIKDYEQNNIISFVSPKLLEDEDINILDKVNEVYSSMDVLKSSSSKIEEGANSLKSGISTYGEKSREFNSAMVQMSSGMNSANNNYTKINDGISKLNDNAPLLVNGSKQIYEGILSVRGGISTLSSSVLGIQTQIISPLKDGVSNLNYGLDSIISGVEQIPVADNVEKINSLQQLIDGNTYTINNLSSLNTTLQEQLNGIEDVNSSEYNSLYTQINTNSSVIDLLKSNNAALNQSIDTLKATDVTAVNTLKTGLTQVKQGAIALQGGIDALDINTQKLKDGVDGMYVSTESLESGSNTLYMSTLSIQEAMATLVNGSAQIKQGLNTLDTSSNKLLEANNMLTDATKTLEDGATELTSGIHTFNIEGINKIYNFLNSDVKDLSTRIDEITKLSKGYNNFSMKDDNTNGNIKFIMITDMIKK